MNVLAPLMGVLILLILLVIVVIIPLIFIIYLRMRYCVTIYIYICSVWMVNVAGCVTGCPFYNLIAGCITEHLVDQPSTHCDRLYNQVGI